MKNCLCEFSIWQKGKKDGAILSYNGNQVNSPHTATPIISFSLACEFKLQHTIVLEQKKESALWTVLLELVIIEQWASSQTKTVARKDDRCNSLNL